MTVIKEVKTINRYEEALRAEEVATCVRKFIEYTPPKTGSVASMDDGSPSGLSFVGYTIIHDDPEVVTAIKTFMKKVLNSCEIQLTKLLNEELDEWVSGFKQLAVEEAQFVLDNFKKG